MSIIDPTTRKDPLIHEIKGENLASRVTNVALPFLLMGRITAQPTALLLSVYQIGSSSQEIWSGDRIKGLASLAHTGVHTALAYFQPMLAPLYSTVCQMIMEEKGCDVKRGARLANHTLFLVSLFIKRPEVLAASLFAQAGIELTEARDACKKGKWLEASGKIALALIRGHAGATQVKEIYKARLASPARQGLWEEVEGLDTGLALEELEAILDYCGEKGRIKGSSHNLPRSITVTDDALYIHLKKKGGVKPLGGGVFKTAYKCVKIEHNHAKLMAELTVRHNIEMAVAEDLLARAVGSPYINGGAEVVLEYGTKLCLIQEMMDLDGSHYVNQTQGSAVNRLQVMEDVARGLGDLHAFGYSHGDLHHGNFLVNTGDEHRGKLSDLGLARKITDNWQTKLDLHELGFLIGEVCNPVWRSSPNDERMQTLKERIRRMDLGETSAYEIADFLKECRLSMGEEGREPLDPKGVYWDGSQSESSTVGPDMRAFVLDFLHRLGFSFDTLPSETTCKGLGIDTKMVMEALGIPLYLLQSDKSYLGFSVPRKGSF